jgi:thiol-disulfide isomerase/thioredoxin
MLAISCGQDRPAHSDDSARLTGTVNNPSIQQLTVQGRGYNKTISVDENGKFSDTLIVNPGIHAISNGSDRLTLFLRNGYDLEVQFKDVVMANGATFKGLGAETNNFIEKKRLFYLSDFANPKTYFSLEEEAFRARLNEARTTLSDLRSGDIDSLVLELDTRNDERFFGYIESNYEVMSSTMTRLAKGKPSPEFVNYENHAGGTSSLSDFKGKLVLLDIWATWCAPCKVEIPHLKKLEEDYKDKSIEIVSISVDVEEAHDTWKKMVESEDLTGVQLYADNNFSSDFIMQYGINAIPRFILINTDGTIIDADAPRPSNPELRTLIDSYLGS